MAGYEKLDNMKTVQDSVCEMKQICHCLYLSNE